MTRDWREMMDSFRERWELSRGRRGVSMRPPTSTTTSSFCRCAPVDCGPGGVTDMTTSCVIDYAVRRTVTSTVVSACYLNSQAAMQSPENALFHLTFARCPQQRSHPAWTINPVALRSIVRPRQQHLQQQRQQSTTLISNRLHPPAPKLIAKSRVRQYGSYRRHRLVSNMSNIMYQISNV